MVAASEGRITTRCIDAYPQARQLAATHFVVCAGSPRYGPFSPVGKYRMELIILPLPLHFSG